MYNRIKKSCAVLAAVSLMMGMVACRNNSHYVGDWNATTASLAGTIINLSHHNLSLKMTLKKDGSALLKTQQDAESVEAKWSATETGIKLESEGKLIELTNKEGKLELPEPESGVVFTMEKEQ